MAARPEKTKIMLINRRHLLQTGAAGAAFAALGTGSALAVTREELSVAGPLGDKSLGDENAPVRIIEYASMTCTHCAHFHETTYPAFKKDFIDTGKVHFTLREFPLDGRALAAFMLARSAPGDRFFEMVDLLFDQQQQWAFVPREQGSTALFNVVKQAGFTQESFVETLKNQELADAVKWVGQRASERFGVHSTPTFFINEDMVAGALEIDDLSKRIEEAAAS
ncbi:MAG: DsbA family protein [Flavobacteriaceae bacterium]